MVILIRAPEDFRHGLHAIYAGSTHRHSTISVTEHFVRRTMEWKYFPNLRHLHILNSVNLTTKTLMYTLVHSPRIKSVVIIAKQGTGKEPPIFDFRDYHCLTTNKRPKSLKYIELGGFVVNYFMLETGIAGLTRIGQDVEMVIGKAEQLRVYRNGDESRARIYI
jgi:hypothetical protein